MGYRAESSKLLVMACFFWWLAPPIQDITRSHIIRTRDVPITQKIPKDFRSSLSGTRDKDQTNRHIFYYFTTTSGKKVGYFLNVAQPPFSLIKWKGYLWVKLFQKSQWGYQWHHCHSTGRIAIYKEWGKVYLFFKNVSINLQPYKRKREWLCVSTWSVCIT